VNADVTPGSAAILRLFSDGANDQGDWTAKILRASMRDVKADFAEPWGLATNN
jgi:hypothetical protein